ncbi:MAG TPA: ribosome maturation factor RimM [Terriglobia bacterium]|nr:ribosome maturation factor RimM [Terriglobia bacterium]
METSATHDRFLAIARIARPQGRRGEVAAEILTDFPERLERLRRVWLAAPESTPSSAPREATIESAWPHKGRMVLKFAGVDSIDAANALRGLHVLVSRQDRVALPDHSYYVWELEGCQVVAERAAGGDMVGTVTAVEPTGGVPNLRVARPGGGEVLIPLAQEICTRIDVAGKRIVVNPPEDLLDLNEQCN